MKILLSLLLICLFSLGMQAQKINDSTTPLHLMAPNYDTPYGKPDEKGITVVLDRIYNYLNQTTPMVLIDKVTKAEVDGKVYGPMVCLAWNAVAGKVNEKGQVEGTCVGTGMGFDPAFYYYRPINVYAAHGYGPVLLAGAEMIELVKTHKIEINDSAVQLYDK